MCSIGKPEVIEFHCMLVRTEVFAKLGALDDQLSSLHEYDELCMAVREAGGEFANFSGNRAGISIGNAVVGNPKLVKTVRKMIREEKTS